MKNLFVILLCVLSFALSAEETETFEQQWGAGVHVGFAKIEGSSINVSGVFDVGMQFEYRKTENTAIKFGFLSGSDDFLNIFSVIFGDHSRYEFDTRYATYVARTSKPLYVFGGAGIAHTSESVVNDGVDSGKNTFGLMAEVGVGWDIGKHFTFNLSHMKVNADFSDISSTQLIAQFRF